MTTQNIIDAARELLDGVTPEPWMFTERNLVAHAGDAKTVLCDVLYAPFNTDFRDKDIQAITLAPALIRALVETADENTRLKARIAALEGAYRHKVGDELLMRFDTHDGHIYRPVTITGIGEIHEAYRVKSGQTDYGNVLWWNLRNADQLGEYDLISQDDVL